MGNRALMHDGSVEMQDAEHIADDMRKGGQTVMFAAIDEKIAALIGVSDPIKSTTPEALKILRRSGLKIIMVSGDNSITA